MRRHVRRGGRSKNPGLGLDLGLGHLAARQEAQEYLVLIDGTNNVLETVRRKDGALVGTYGRPGATPASFTGCMSARSTRAAIFTPARSIPVNACRNGCRGSSARSFRAPVGRANAALGRRPAGYRL
jgi:hypothetical protein